MGGRGEDREEHKEEVDKEVDKEENKEENKEKDKEEITDEDEDELPSWLWEAEDPGSYFMPVNTLTLTEERTVVRV